MSKIKGQSSTEYGESLLGEMQASNERIRKDNQSSADKYARMNIGVNAAIGFADSIMEKKHNEFINNEKNAANIIKTRGAYTATTDIFADEKAAQSFAGGYNAYWAAQGEAKVDIELSAGFQEGTYNKTTYNLLKKSRGTDVGKLMLDAHTKRLKASNNYLSLTGKGGEDAYLTALSGTKPKDIQGSINSYLGKVTGLSAGDEISKRASMLLDSATSVETFDVAYKDVRNAEVAILLAKELPDSLGVPVSVKGEITSTVIADGFGGEEIVNQQAVTAYDKNGVGTTFMANLDDNTIEPVKSFTDKNNFLTKVAAGSKIDAIVNLGQSSLSAYIQPSEREALDEKIKEHLKQSKFNFMQDEDKAKAGTALVKNVHAKVGVMVRTLQQELGISAVRASQVAVRMIVNDPSVAGSGSTSKGAGIGSPYHTLQAMSQATSTGNAEFAPATIDTIIGAQGTNMVNAYLNSSTNERTQLATAIELLPAMSEKTQQKIEMAQRLAVRVSELNPRLYESTAQAIQIADRQLTEEAQLNTVNQAAQVQAPVEKVAVAPDLLMSTLPLPPKAPDSRQGRMKETASSKQQRTEYLKVIKTQKRKEEILKNPVKKGSYSYSRIKPREDNAIKYADNLYSAYIKKYGEVE